MEMAMVMVIVLNDAAAVNFAPVSHLVAAISADVTNDYIGESDEGDGEDVYDDNVDGCGITAWMCRHV